MSCFTLHGCRYFCLASKQPLPVSLPSTVQPCRCTPSLLLQLKGRQAGEQTLTAAAQQTLVRKGTVVLSDALLHAADESHLALFRVYQYTTT